MTPWENEPDRKEWMAHGLRCVIQRIKHSGHLCGYVGVPKGHPLYGASVFEPHPFFVERNLQEQVEPPVIRAEYIAWAIRAFDERNSLTLTVAGRLTAHGGVNYGDNHLPHEALEGIDLWWFGFSCDHSGDDYPSQSRVFSERYGYVYRDMAYVTEQTENLARQLAELGGDAA